MTNQLERAYWRGYYSELIRLDAKKCSTGTACGNTCIPKGDQCRGKLSLGIRQRLKGLLDKLRDGVDRGLGKVVAKLEKVEADKVSKQQAQHAERKRLEQEAILQRGPLKTIEQVRAVQDYSTNGYKHMNACARGQKVPAGVDCEVYNRKAEHMEEALELLPKNTDGTPHYRGIAARAELAKMFSDLKEGDTFSDPGFASFSKDRETADFFIDNYAKSEKDLEVVLVTRSRKLANISGLSKHDEEEESVLPRGHRHRVTKVTRDGLRLTIELEDA